MPTPQMESDMPQPSTAAELIRFFKDELDAATLAELQEMEMSLNMTRLMLIGDLNDLGLDAQAIFAQKGLAYA